MTQLTLIRNSRPANCVYFIGHYAPGSGEYGRVAAPSAVAKIDYVTDCIRRSGYDVEIISPLRSTYSRGDRARESTSNNGHPIRYLRSLPWGTRPQKALNALHGQVALFHFLMTKIPPGQTIIAYHSLSLGFSVQATRILRRHKLILEAEEVYSHVPGIGKWRQLQESIVLRTADAYILSTELIRSYTNTRKPSLICYGPYNDAGGPSPRTNKPYRSTCVYAGIVDEDKGGALRAVQAAQFLDNSYRVRILGFGSDRSITALKRAIEQSPARSRITFEGKLVGREFQKVLSECDIGLCTQSSTANFNGSSFPSKVLTYLAHGLRVVSVPAQAVQESKLKAAVSFSRDDSPEAIAQAIRQARESSTQDPKRLLRQLDYDFVQQLKSELQRQPLARRATN
ncbi:glycosyltransferase [Nostocoides veronense]|uniref:Glycosyltransferase n=1 Tax=Nostocoides veronense TaxID=330836 RepID=A0ABP4XMV8_9MICO